MTEIETKDRRTNKVSRNKR